VFIAQAYGIDLDLGTDYAFLVLMLTSKGLQAFQEQV
jgi:Na+/H+-dicarboxylate symporter